MAVGFRTLMRQLDAAHKRQVAKLAVLRCAWVALSAVLALILADLLFALGELPRVGLDLAALAGCVSVGVGSYWILRRARSRERMVARLVEEHCPDFENTLVNAVDFDSDLEQGARESVSRDLMQEAIAAAAEHVLALPNHRSLRPDTFKREGIALVLAAITLVAMGAFLPRVVFTILPRFAFPYADFPPYNATSITVEPAGAAVDYGESLRVAAQMKGPMPRNVSLVLRNLKGRELSESPMFDAGDGLFFQTIENIQDDIEYFVRIPRGRSKRFRVAVTKLPRIELVTTTYTYPAYTRRPVETSVYSGEAIKGYPNTEVAFTVTSNRELREGRLTVGGRDYALAPKEATSVEGSFAITGPADFSVTIVNVDGNASKEPLAGKVEVIEDEKPEVTISVPGMDSFSVPDAEVPIVVDGTDDLGLTNISIYRSHNESDDSRKALYTGDGAEDIVSVTETLNLKDLGVRPGDVIDYYVTATDSRPDAPQTTSTESFRLQIISFDEYRSAIQSEMTATDLKEKYDAYLEEMEKLTAAQEELEQKTASLRDKLNESGEASLTPEEAEQLQEAAEQQRQLAEAAKGVQEDLEKEADTPEIFDVEKGYKEALRELAQRVGAAREHMERAGQEMSEAAQSSKDSQEGQRSGDAKSSLEKAGGEQKEALENLRKNEEEFKNAIQKPNENIEKVSSLMADVEMFKYLYTLQKGLERQVRYYKDAAGADLDAQVRLKELSEQQDAVKQELTALKEAIALHADELEKLGQATEVVESVDQPPAQVESPGNEPSNN